MTTRGADYPRQPLDNYPTPPEAIDVLFDNVKLGPRIFDPACGKEKRIIRSAARHGIEASGRDLISGSDFSGDTTTDVNADFVINPPYDFPGERRGLLAVRFIEQALISTEKHRKRVAVLLPIDFDSGKTRRHIFGAHRAFALKLVLLDRIKWFDGKAGSTNHCWCVWDWKHKGHPIIKYARIESKA